ncbi:amino acid adenylation protein [Pilimelia anulata]|uniref:Amino acid adenylation protein n=1 Tax=Pilimelia anulata TaxID=53371 RepID=A0A8J3F9I8_9ACTN|nr:Pls/PosA family non-ribosomal peptide synthetase [Pilimelia anulata]GGJ87030.1 amino acid adenylation protein [Pilimelia anulata]
MQVNVETAPLVAAPDGSRPRAVYTAGPAAPARTLVDIFRATVRRAGRAPAIDDGVTILTYSELSDRVDAFARRLRAAGVVAGSRVGVRLPSGSVDLYLSILAVLHAGAAYVPVDAEDPDERAELVFGEAGVEIVIGPDRELTHRTPAPPPTTAAPGAAPEPPAAPERPAAPGTATDPPLTAADPTGPATDPPLTGTAPPAAAATPPGSPEPTESTAPPAPPTPISTAPTAPTGTATPPTAPTATLDPPASTTPPTGTATAPTGTATAPTGTATPPAAAPDATATPPAGSTAAPTPRTGPPGPDDDAWIIFTSGSTGTPKGVAVSHRAAAAFVDAEARLFLAGTDEPLGTEDRVLAGLSVAFDASCEEMWLAWRHGACLVPAPRALVRSGVDLGPWLVEREITVVSTVPTLAALWPVDALDDVRLLIFGGEACPPELAERLAVDGREVWNTYGPTEATVVACAARLTGTGPVRIGLPLDGWELAVVDPAGALVGRGEQGELVIGGVGLARYLDAAKDAEKYAPLPALGWDRAYRSGDLVRADAAGLVFLGRIDEQVKLGGRRIELGEVDAALQALPGVAGAAAAVRRTAGGHQLLVGYVVPEAADFDPLAAADALRATLPAALVPLVAVVDTLPTRTSGKVDRAALPWPLPTAEPATTLTGTEAWLAGLWHDVLGAPVTGADDDFFRHGGSSLAAAQLVSRLRERYPDVAVGDLYQHPTLGGLAKRLELFDTADLQEREIGPMPRWSGLVRTLLLLPLLTVVAARWAVPVAAAGTLLNLTGPHPWAPTAPWWLLAAGWLLLFSPPGRLALGAGAARLLLRRLRPGEYPRGGSVHVRLWLAERFAAAVGATGLTGGWLTAYARALGARLAPGTDLHAAPPLTGLLRVGRGAAVEPEVDLSGYWVDGDVLRVGRIRIGAGATVGARSTLLPGARVGKRAEVAAGSCVLRAVPAGESWAGVPAQRTGRARPHPGRRPRRSRRWALAYGVTSLALDLLPAVAALPGLAVLGRFLRGEPTAGDALLRLLVAVPPATVAAGLTYALLVLLGVRLLSIGLVPGQHPVHGRVAWQAWATERLMNGARVVLFPLYASLLTPTWLRALGMRVGRGVEASTVVALPKMTRVGDGAFLADDTMIASYELGGGRLRIDGARIGKRAFLGNSGMTAPGHRVPNGGLVGVLSAAPKRAKPGSSWLGMPPMKLPRAAEAADASRTFDPPARLRLARAAVELCRLLPVCCSVGLAAAAAVAFGWLLDRYGPAVALAAGGALLAAAGVLACLLAIAAKWLLVGRFRAVEKPLWSGFVWRNELADTFVEVLAVPWLVGAATGTPVLSWWLRGLGARVGRGVWCESYWLPEADLVTLGAGATVNRGCVLQTHLFHDRIMRMDTVTIATGATVGPHGIVLPAAAVGAHATVGPASLVLRGETVPAHGRWLGNPIAPWRGR